MRRTGRHDHSRLDTIQFRETLIEVRFAFILNPALLGPASLGRALSITAVEVVHHIHPFRDLTEGRKALAIEKSVVAEIDKDLGCSRVGASGGEGDIAALITLLYWVILDYGGLPNCIHRRFRVDAELNHKRLGFLDHAEKTGIRKKSILHQVVKTVRAQRGPGASDFNHINPFGGCELRFVNFGGFLG